MALSRLNRADPTFVDMGGGVGKPGDLAYTKIRRRRALERTGSIPLKNCHSAVEHGCFQVSESPWVMLSLGSHRSVEELCQRMPGSFSQRIAHCLSLEEALTQL